MLAGFLRTDDLWRLTSDRDFQVRATALHWLCRISPPDDIVAWDRIIPKLATEPPSVRAAIIRGLPSVLPDTVDAIWLDAIDDPNPEVRHAVVDRIASLLDDDHRRSAAPRLMTALKERLDAETDRALLGRLKAILGVDETPSPTGTRFPLMCIH